MFYFKLKSNKKHGKGALKFGIIFKLSIWN